MLILVTGPAQMLAEFAERFGEPAEIHYHTVEALPEADLKKADAVLDLWLDSHPERIQQYQRLEGLTVFCNVPKSSLAGLVARWGRPSCTLVGINALSGFINRPLLELSLLEEGDLPRLKTVCAALGADYRLVQDRVGMVTPRVICQIINEAYYTLQEGTASRQDIDLGMQLGTNYPLGPFAWSQKIGIKHVYELLEALWQDTGDERYKICPLLKREYLLQEAAEPAQM
ncbi:3-hydroxyacyl-CoA dehydrogenase family protein [Cesiribacter andamanensis]|uniref:Putative 3-hydroxybutyryl-CoA dehydrogenase n=1 Tax=Cesiribacter andamanensis AMV16 TaxID=1279009 RepID=M7N5J8_9BACT|nr:3-hydroxyacyl-CoA dehydrogenase family protein [Cesiribacter andamanensis]EMR02506.1 putative 3-hydroxybutyryl-CoA dehydrogenase [Cesiribacter andamanensis AMV16]